MQVDDRQEYDNRRQRRGDNSPCHFRRTCNGCLAYRHPFLLVTEDALDHYNRIVDQHTRSEGQTAECHDVQGKMIEEHQVERSNDRDRDRQTDNQRRP